MVNRARGKGTSAESAVVDYLRENGWPWAERRALAGASDRGDVSGCPGLVWEVKYAGAGIRMGAWMDETVQERANAKADHAILVIKPSRYGAKKIDRWLAVMPAWDFDNLMYKMTSPSLHMVYSAPAHFVQGSIVADLADFAVTDGQIPVLQRRPPGTKETSDQWYRITYLKHVVTLLRMAGYGSPLDE